MRLINADDVIEMYTNRLFDIWKAHTPMITTKKYVESYRICKEIAISEVDKIPTAYDVNSVIEELEKEKDIHATHFNLSIYKDEPEIKQRYKQALGIIDKSIEIVKKGENNE